MTRKDALAELIAKVEAGIWPAGTYGLQPMTWSFAFDAFHGSIDAAKAVHEAMLPEWTRAVDATTPEIGVFLYT